MTDLGKVKGAAISEFFIWLQEHHPGRIPQILDAVPAAHRSSFTPGMPALGLISGAWYPSEIAHAFCDGLTTVFAPVELKDILREGVAVTMEQNVGKLWKRVFMRWFMGPAFYAKNSQRLWGLHFDNGVLTTEIVEPGVLQWAVNDWRGHHEVLCALVCHAEPAVFGAMGCHDVMVDGITCTAWGDPQCRHTIRWTT